MLRAVVLALALTLALPAVSGATLRAFRSPSGNIGCLYYRDKDTAPSVRCDVTGAGDYAWRVRATGKGRKIRVTDTVMVPDAPVLAYGKSRDFGRITCISRPSGMTCRNDGGGGFTVSRERKRVF
jgi:hypothetical protein